jgi:hypothetical protein
VNPHIASADSSRSSLMGLMVSCAVLGLMIGPFALLIASMPSGGVSDETLARAGIGGGVCWLAAVLALTATYLGNRLQAPVHGLLAGMLFRLGLPLAAIVVLPKLEGPLAGASITTTILGTYFVALIVETALSLRMVPVRVPATKAT